MFAIPNITVYNKLTFITFIGYLMTSTSNVVKKPTKKIPLGIFAKPFIEHCRTEGKIKERKVMYTVATKCPHRKTLEYFEGEDDLGPFVAVLLAGRKNNPYKGNVFLVTPEFFKTMPKLCWIANAVSENTVSIHSNAPSYGSRKMIMSALADFLGLPEKTLLFPLYHPFDLRHVTQTRFAALRGDGTCGIHNQKNKYWEVRFQFSNDFCPSQKTKLEAQQQHNAMLLKHKLKNPNNLHCFGRIYDDEAKAFANVFPTSFYDKKGDLLSEFKEIYDQNSHLFVPLKKPLS